MDYKTRFLLRHTQFTSTIQGALCGGGIVFGSMASVPQNLWGIVPLLLALAIIIVSDRYAKAVLDRP